MHFQSKPYIQNINLAPTCFGAAGVPSSGSTKDPDEIVRILHHKCQISEENSHSVPSADNAQTGSTSNLHLFDTYDVEYAQFHQDPLGSLKMALL
jgi:hypothetical protein